MVKKGKPIKDKKKELKRLKFPLDWAITKLLPPVHRRLDYTPQELRYKFTQYIERSDKYGEEITISGFSVFASINRDYLYNKDVKSQELSDVISEIHSVFEYRYEQLAAKGGNIPYLMNNRRKDRRQSLNKQEHSGTIATDVSGVLDQILNKKDGGKK